MYVSDKKHVITTHMGRVLSNIPSSLHARQGLLANCFGHSNGAGKIKEITQNRRDTTNRKIATGGTYPVIPKSLDCAIFLSNGDNKTDLIQFIAGY